MPGKHLDIATDFSLSPTQKAILEGAIADNNNFSDVCVYVNTEYIGGRPNDRG